jgi:hypothetical protein
MNTRLLRAWPNYLLIPAIAAYWLVVGVLVAELFGAPPFESESKDES